MAKKKDDSIVEDTKEEKTPLQEALFRLEAAESHCCELTHDGLNRTADVLGELQKGLREVASYVNNPPKGKVSAKETSRNSDALALLANFRKKLVLKSARAPATVIALRNRDRSKTDLSPRTEIALSKLILAVLDDITKKWDVLDSNENKDI